MKKHPTNTEFIKKKSPLLWAVLSFTLKRLEAIAIAAALSGIGAACNYLHEKHDTQWISQHLQQKETEIQQLQKESQ